MPIMPIQFFEAILFIKFLNIIVDRINHNREGGQVCMDLKAMSKCTDQQRWSHKLGQDVKRLL